MTKKQKLQKQQGNLQYKEVHLKEGEIVEITPDMLIGDVIFAYPQVKEVFDHIGISCASCYAAFRDSIAEGAILHGIDPQKLCQDINDHLKKA